MQVFDALRLILQHVQACLLLGCYLVLFERYALPIILRMWLSPIMHLPPCVVLFWSDPTCSCEHSMLPALTCWTFRCEVSSC